MINNLLLMLSSKRKLVKSIKTDNYKNWEEHIDKFNSSSAKKADPLKLKSLGLQIYERNLKEIISDYSITNEERQELEKIKSYFQLSTASIDSIKAKYAKGAVNNLSKSKLADNRLSDAEVKEIELFAKELNISEYELNKINQQNAIDLYESALRQVVSDKMVTFEEQKQLQALAQQLGLKLDQVSIDKKLSENYKYLVLINALDHGYLPQLNSPSILLQKNEVAYWQVSANLLISKVVTTGYIGGSRGVSIRVMKGVSYRVGASRSTPIKEHVTTKYPGVLVITSKRVVFAGSQKSFSIPFSQLIAFEPYSDGIGLQKNNKELVLQFNDKNISEVVFKVLTNAINLNI